MPTERCEGCGFDSTRWDDADTLNTILVLGALWRLATVELPAELVHVRAEPEQWSIGEYADHVREVLFAMRFAVDTALREPGHDLGASPDTGWVSDEPRRVDLDAAIDGIGGEAGALLESLTGLTPEQWASTAVVDGEGLDVAWLARHAVHDTTHHLRDVGRIRVRLGDGVPPMTGTVSAIHVSDGGVPKRAVPSAEVGWSGLVGDRQADRRHHGRPFQAVCLWSAEVIDGLRAEGHPISPGSAGENVTLSGLDWAALRPGARLTIGDVTAEISSYAVPCSKNAAWFADRRFDRIHHERHPGWSRLYAWVLEPGAVSVGDEVRVES